MFNAPFFGGVFLTSLAVYLLVKKREAKRLIQQSKDWPTATGRMINNKATQYSATSTRWDFLAEYTYMVDGKEYKGFAQWPK